MPAKTRMVLASSNQHKCDEIRQIIGAHIDLVLQSDLGISSPPETGTTFVENAIIKARHASNLSGLPALADDSGLCVTALLGEPGIFSARYAGEGATDIANYQLLLSRLGNTKQREAVFHCVIVVLDSAYDPAPVIAEGYWQGLITLEPRGETGFGYDPVFIVPDLGKTAAELPAVTKNQLSHRARALAVLGEQLRERYPA